MIRVVLAIIFLIVLGLIVGLVVYSLKNSSSGIKIMLLGINITLLGGIIAVDPNSNLAGIEYLIAFSGLLISLAGLIRKD